MELYGNGQGWELVVVLARVSVLVMVMVGGNVIDKGKPNGSDNGNGNGTCNGHHQCQH